MYLQKIAIINYRSCRDLVLEFGPDLPNTFIGCADAGKTTIMKGIGLLMDEKTIPRLIKDGLDTSDISTTQISDIRYREIFNELKIPFFDFGTEKSILVIGIFKKQTGDFEDDFEDIASGHLKWSLESNSEDEIVILRQFNSQYPNGRYLICSKDGDGSYKELWGETQANLDKIIKDLKITKDDITNDNSSGRFKKIEKFRTIYNKSSTSLQWATYEEYVKNDRKFFPNYRYIDWKEITLKAVEEIAKETMMNLIGQYEQKLKNTADLISKKATLKLNSELKKKMSLILSGLPGITAIKARVFFNPSENVSEISIEKNTADGAVSLESQGDGIKKQIGFAFMRLAAIQKVSKGNLIKKYVWCFDEPETHLYPPDKREFYEIIKKLSSNGFQSFVSTHSTVFVDKSKMNTIRKVELKNKYTNVSSCSTITDLQENLGIKNSDFLFFDKFVVGEGETDKELLPYLYKLYFSRTFEDDSIQFIDLGGAGNRKANKKLFEQLLKDFKDPNDCVYYVFDKDQNSHGNNVFSVGFCDLEDSISDKFWIRLVKDSCGFTVKRKDLVAIRGQLDPTNQNKKFHKLLTDLVSKQKTKTGYLPGKIECGKLMTKYIIKKKDIPNDIVMLFKEIKKNG